MKKLRNTEAEVKKSVASKKGMYQFICSESNLVKFQNFMSAICPRLLMSQA